MSKSKSKSSTSAAAFASEGFDVDALGKGNHGEDNHNADNVVLELGGGVSQLRVTEDDLNSNSTAAAAQASQAPSALPRLIPDEALHAAEAYKLQGNTYYARQQYEEAVQQYTCAIDATPGHPTGLELVQMHDEWKKAQDLAWRKKLADLDEQRRKDAMSNNKSKSKTTTTPSNPTTTQHPTNTTTTSASQPQPSHEHRSHSTPSNQPHDPHPQRPKEVFQPNEIHPHSSTLAVYHGNRAAAYIGLRQYDAAVRDCDQAILLDPTYVKARVRRAAAYEHSDPPNTEAALVDITEALALLDSTQPTSSSTVVSKQRHELRMRRDALQKREDARLEQLKTETMDKLKELGNTILGNFGLSLDNFKAVQDPNTGSYSINFQQGGGQK